MLSLQTLVLATSLAATATVSGLAGWTVQGWRKDGEITALTAKYNAERAAQYQAALDELTKAAAVIHLNAAEAKIDISTLRASLSDIRKEIKNAKPLPVDCKPDAIRLQRFQSSVDATNKAIARPKSGQ